MLYRKLGRTGIDVGVVGLGTEFLWHESLDTTTSVLDEAIENGLNYIDLFMPSPEVRDNFGNALKGRRDKVIIEGHLGSVEKEGQYFKTREKIISEKYIDDLLIRLKTDYIDVLMLHFVDEPDDYASVFNSGGLLELALRLKAEGKARFIGMSSHRVPVSMMAVNSGYIDVLLFPVNPAFDMLPGNTDLEALWQDQSYKQLEENKCQLEYSRRELYLACEKQGVGIAAMKPYAAGWLFSGDKASSMILTPTQCISYCLSQPGIFTVVPGCKDVSQMRAALSYINSSDIEKDYSEAISKSKWNLKGRCMYCNHCLPCPVNINVAETTRIADSAANGITDSLRARYEALTAKASECIQCGSCMQRCPFDVDVISNMERTAALFVK